MSSAQTKATRRMVVASFAAGASAMVLLGLVAPIAMKGGFAMREAFAAEAQQTAPVIQPLDVQAIEAQLADADRLMGEMRAETADEMGRLEQLSGR